MMIPGREAGREPTWGSGVCMAPVVTGRGNTAKDESDLSAWTGAMHGKASDA